MKSIVFLSYEGVTDTIFESQVLEHCEKFPAIHLFLLPNNIAAYNKSKLYMEKNSKNFKISLLRSFNQKIPLSELINALQLYKVFKENKIKDPIIHARSDYAAAVATLLKLLISCTVIWDCRGDTVSEQKLANCDNGSPMEAFMRMLAIKNRIWIARRFSDAIIFVSTALRDTISQNHRNTFIIPCCSNGEKFYYDNQLRLIKRKELNISNPTTVFIYSGSTTGKYHIFDRTVELFQKIQNENQDVLFIILTPNINDAEEKLKDKNIKNFILKCVNMDGVNEYLNAADYGVILRDKSNVNYVSSPVKFSEYSMAGLRIITTNNIHQTQELKMKLNNIEFCDLNNISNFHLSNTPFDRLTTAEVAKKYFERNSYEQIYKNLYFSRKVN